MVHFYIILFFKTKTFFYKHSTLFQLMLVVKLRDGKRLAWQCMGPWPADRLSELASTRYTDAEATRLADEAKRARCLSVYGVRRKRCFSTFSFLLLLLPLSFILLIRRLQREREKERKEAEDNAKTSGENGSERRCEKSERKKEKLKKTIKSIFQNLLTF